MTLLVWVGQLIWFYIPAGVANMTPVLVRNHLPFLAVPIDHNLTLGGKPILGTHKTWRGLLIGTLCAELVFLGQKYLTATTPWFIEWTPYNYTDFPWWFGAIFGLGALGGDIIKSFFKRRFTIREGAMWFPFDQIDFVVGATFILTLFTYIDIGTWLTVILLAVFFHILVNRIGFHLGLKNTPW